MTQLRVVADERNRDSGKPNPASSILKLKGSEMQQATTELLMDVVGPYVLPYDDEDEGSNEPPIGPDLRGRGGADLFQLAQDLDLRRLERDPAQHRGQGDPRVLTPPSPSPLRGGAGEGCQNAKQTPGRRRRLPSMTKAAIFDVDGTLVNSVDLHAAAWQRALAKFGHRVSFIDVRAQIGKGGDKLLPVFLSEAEQDTHGKEIEAYRSDLFKQEYLPLVRPFSAVPELMHRIRDAGIKIAVASSAKQDELDGYLVIAGISDLVDAKTSSDDAGGSKPDPDIFQAALAKLGIAPSGAIAIGDTPYDAIAAGRAGIACVGVLSGGFTEADLRKAGCIEAYPGPAAILACFDDSPLTR